MVKKLIGIAVVIVVGIIFVMIFNATSSPNEKSRTTKVNKQTVPQNQDENSPSASDAAITVSYDDNGFTPKELTITKGTTVKFVNKSSMPLWVASDPHPEHTDYPEFDTYVARNRRPKLGEDFSFKFEKVGTWKYHSHTASGDESDTSVHPGVIIVK